MRNNYLRTWSEPRPTAIQTRGNPTLVCGPNIGNGTSSIAERRCSTDTSEKPEENQDSSIWSESTGYLEEEKWNEGG